MRGACAKLRWVSLVVVVLVCSGVGAAPGDGPGEVPDAKVAGPTTQPEVADNARGLLEGIVNAVAGVKGYRASGTIEAEVDVGGEKGRESEVFESVYVSPGRFRFRLGDKLVIGQSEKWAYLFMPGRNEYLRVATGGVGEVPGFVSANLEADEPLLKWALTDVRKELMANAKRVAAAGEQQIGEVKCSGLRIERNDAITVTLWVFPAGDARAGLPRRIVVDRAGEFEAQGVPAVRRAVVTVDYGVVDLAIGNVGNEVFDFVPPETATNVSEGTDPAATRPTLIK